MDSKAIKCMHIVAVYLAIWIVLLITLLLALWPKISAFSPNVIDPNEFAFQITDPNRDNNEVDKPTETEQPDPNSQKSDTIFSLPPGQYLMSCLRMVGLVLIIGALGSCLHGITSLAYHRSQDNFAEKWTLWYLYRPFVGGILALIFYLIINGRLVPQVENCSQKFFGMLGLSGLIGLFSKQALNKLSLIFDAIFASDKENNEKSPKTPQKPVSPPESNSKAGTATPETKTKEKPADET